MSDLMEVIYKRITITGFFGWDFLTRFDRLVRIIGDWIRQGKIQAIEDISDKLENVRRLSQRCSAAKILARSSLS